MSKLNVFSLAILLCLAASTRAAQSNYASLSGTVFDQQRQAVPGVIVRATSATTRPVRQATTNAEGASQLAVLLPGEYELTVEAKGFASLTRTVNVEVGQQLTLDVDLKVSDISTTAEVKGEAAGPGRLPPPRVARKVSDTSTTVKVKGEAGVLRTTDARVGEVAEPKSVRSL